MTCIFDKKCYNNNCQEGTTECGNRIHGNKTLFVSTRFNSLVEIELKNLLTNRKSCGILNMKSEGHTLKPEREVTMKLNVKLTADELQNVLDAAANEALDNGLLYDDDNDDMACLFAAVDAALAAIGIEVSEDTEAEEEEEEEEEEDYDEWDEDEDEEDEDEEEVDPIEEMIYVLEGKRVISKDNAHMLLNMMADVVKHDNRIPAEAKGEFAQLMFIKFCADKGIWGVDNRDE